MPVFRHAEPTPLLVAVAEWRDFLRASYSPHTERSYTQALFLYLREGPGKDYGEHTTADLAAWLGTFPYRSSTRRTYYQALRSFFGYCRRVGFIEQDPTEALRAPAVATKVPEALTAGQVADIVRAAQRKGGMRPWAILLLYHTGMRLHELCSLRWEDVKDDRIRVREAKGGRERFVPVGPALRQVFDHLREFSGPEGRVIPRGERTVWGWVHDAGMAAGYRNVHPHLLRATTATVMLGEGAPVHQVARFLGHSSIKTTQKYAAVTEKDLQRAANLLSEALDSENEAHGESM